MTDSGDRQGRHDSREDLAGEHALADIGQLVLAAFFFVTWIVDSAFFEWTTFLNVHVAAVVRVPIAGILLALSAYMAWASHRTIFGKKREEPRVVHNGVFAVVRHPMYLSEILLYLGLLLLSVSLMAAGVWLLTIAFLHFIARKEEQLLLARFGDEYASYMRRVPMWLPWRLKR